MTRSVRTAWAPALLLGALVGCTADMPVPFGTGPRRDGTRDLDAMVADPAALARHSAEIAATNADPHKLAVLSFGTQAGRDAANATLLRGSRAERELNNLKDCILRGWPGTPPLSQVRMATNRSPGGQALPGEIQLYMGLLGADDVEDREIVFILSHELAHLLLDHFDRKEFKDGQEHAFELLAEGSSMAVAFSASSIRRSGNGYAMQVDDPEALRQGNGLVHAGFVTSQLVADGVVESAWSRDQEHGADRLGLDLMSKAGFAYDGYARIFDRFATYESGSRTKLEAYKTKADGAIQAAIAKGDIGAVATEALASLIGGATAVLSDVYDWFNDSHPSPVERSGKLRSYVDIAYEGENAVGYDIEQPCETEALMQALRAKEFATLSRQIGQIEDAYDKLYRDEVGAARKAAEGTLTGVLRRHPASRYAAYVTTRRAGDSRAALAHLQAVDRSPDDTPFIVYASLIAELARAGRVREGQAILDEASGSGRFAEELFHPMRMQLAFARGDKVALFKESLACKGADSGDIRRTCKTLAEAYEKGGDAPEALEAQSRNPVAGGIDDLGTAFREALAKKSAKLPF